jgi:hypothetical protein
MHYRDSENVWKLWVSSHIAVLHTGTETVVGRIMEESLRRRHGRGRVHWFFKSPVFGLAVVHRLPVTSMTFLEQQDKLTKYTNS